MSKHLVSAYLALAAMAISEPGQKTRRTYNSEPIDQDALQRENTQLLIKRGAKLFEIEGRTYLALNEKNAIKKHNRYKSQNP